MGLVKYTQCTLPLGFSSLSSVGESELGYGLWNNRIISVSNHSNFKAVLGDIKAKLIRLEKASFLQPPFRDSFCSYKNVSDYNDIQRKLYTEFIPTSYLELSN